MSNAKGRTLAWGALRTAGRELGAPPPPEPLAATPAPAPAAPRPSAKTIDMRGQPAPLGQTIDLGAASQRPTVVASAAPEPAVQRRPVAGTIELKPDLGNIATHDTVAADVVMTSPPVSAPSSVAAITLGSESAVQSMRSTVLPRLEHVGASPRLVVDGKTRYEQTRKLGEGGMGEVLQAHDNDIGRPVALKRLRSEVSSPSTLARFVDEIRTVGMLEHPNIIPIHDVGVDGPGEYYFVMKYIDGETLETIIERLAAGDPSYHARYGFETRVQIFRGILEAVAFAHSKGILHRDIKPANVMVGAYGEVILMDWGIAKSIGTPAQDWRPASNDVSATQPEHAHGSKRGRAFATQIGALVGTPAYMSPEQARGEALDERSDVYSLSILFHELLTLQHYLDKKTTLDGVITGVTHDDVPHAASVSSPHQPIVPVDLSWYVRGGTAKDPTKRFASVQAMLDRLDRRAEGDIPIECPMTFVKSMNNKYNRLFDRHPFFMVAMFATLLIGLVGGAVGFGLHLRG